MDSTEMNPETDVAIEVEIESTFKPDEEKPAIESSAEPDQEEPTSESSAVPYLEELASTESILPVLPLTVQSKKFSCSLCKTVFKTFYQLYKHRHKGTVCRDAVGSNFQKRICARCRKSFNNATTFRKHVVSCWRMAIEAPLRTPDEAPIGEDPLKEEKALKPKYVAKRKAAPKRNCGVCGIRFKSASHYTLHLRKKNACRAPPYVCGKCNKEFSSVHNLMVHEKRKNSCMWYHLQRGVVNIPIHFDEPKPLDPADDQLLVEDQDQAAMDCLQCGKSFEDLAEFQQHLHTEPYGDKAQTNPKTPKAEPGVTPVENASPNDEDTYYASCRGPEGFRCQRCFMTFPFLYRFKNHLNRKVPCSAGVPMPIVPSTLPASRPTGSDIKRSARKTFPPMRFEPDEEDDFLNAQFYSDQNLQKKGFPKSKKATHQEFDTGSVPIEEKSMAPGNDDLVCTDCNRSFTSTSAWYKHGKKYHYQEGTNPVTCPECNASFQHKYLLLGHQRKFLHFGNEHSYCPFCKKQFLTFRSRNAHIIKSHKKFNPVRVKDFISATTCQLCKKKFVDQQSKDHHMKTQHKGVISLHDPVESILHRPMGARKGHSCLKCKLSFETEQLFTAHIPRCSNKIRSRPVANHGHTLDSQGNVTVYHCNECSMTFTTKHHFSAHQNRFCPKKTHSKTHAMALKSNYRGRGILSIANGEFGFICSLCKMKFNSRFQYSLHARSFCPMKNKRAGLKLIFRPLALKAKQAETSDENPWQADAKQRAQAVEQQWQHSLKAKQSSQMAQNSWQFTVKAKQKTQATPKPWQLALKAQDRDLSFVKPWQQSRTVEKPWQPAITVKQGAPTEGKTVVSCKNCKVQFTQLLEYRLHDCDEMRPPASASASASEPPKIQKEFGKKAKKKFYVKTVNKAAVITSSMSYRLKKYPTHCPFCRRRYCNSYVRDRHLKLHTLDRSFSCMHCSECFLRSEYLTRHLQAEHHHLLKFECNKCELRYPSRPHCIQHIKKMHRSCESAKLVSEVAENRSSSGLMQAPTKPIVKPVKKITSKVAVSLPSNIMLVAKNAPGKGIFSCELCKVSNFAKMSSLQRHLKSRLHKENIYRRRLRMAKKRKPPDSTENKKLTCSVCKQLFTTVRTFVPHRLSHFNTKNADPTEISENNPYACEICAREFSHHQRVQAHLLWHLRAIKAPHFSTSQSATSSSLVGLERLSSSGSSQANSPIKEGSAKKSIGGGSPTKQPKKEFDHDLSQVTPSSLTCSKCSATFSTARQCRSHDCATSIVCPYCGLSFCTQKGFSVHKNKWCTKKPLFKFFSCRYCALEFESADDVGWHEKSCRKVHGSEKGSFGRDESKFSCKYCNETLVSYKILLIHERDCTQKPTVQKLNDSLYHSLQCLTCQQMFYTGNNQTLEKHAQMHPGEIIRVCCLSCDKTLESLEDVYKHLEKQKSLVNSLRDQFDDRSSDNLTGSVKGDEDSGVYNSRPKNIESDGSFEPETFVVHSPKLGKLYQCIHCRKLYRDKYHLKAHLVLHKPFVCKICGEMECTTQGYQSHPCRLPDGSFATGILHRKKWIKSSSGRKPRNPNFPGSVASTPTSDIASCHVSDIVDVVAEPEKDNADAVTVKTEPGLDAHDQEALDTLRDNFSQLLFLLVADPDLMNTLGWGKKLVDLVLDDVLVHLGQQPVDSVKISSDVERLRQNILLFLQLCIKDDVLTSVGGCAKPIETVVTEMLHVCTDGLPENLPNGTNTFTNEATNV